MSNSKSKSVDLRRKKVVPTKKKLRSLKELKEVFMKYQQAQGRATRTLKDYERHLGEFLEYTNSLELEILEEKITALLDSKKHLSPVTYNHYYAYTNAMFNWAVKQKYLDYNPLKATGLKKRREDSNKIRYVEEHVIKKLLDTIDTNTYTGLRDYTIVLLTLDTGIRPSEAFGLKRNDIDFDQELIVVPAEIAKTRRTRILPLSPQVAKALLKLIEVTPDEFGGQLFVSCDGYPMNTDSWAHRLYYYSQKMGYKVTPYMLRHTFAIMFVRNGGNAFALQKILGHSKMDMTRRYVELALSDVEQQHTVASPVNNFVKRATRIRRIK